MSITQIFCNVAEMYEDLEIAGAMTEAKLLAKIQAASQVLAMQVGRFLPVIETRVFGAPRANTRLFVPPLLSVTTLVNDDVTITSGEYLLQPTAKHWDDGPYSCLEIDPDATLISAWSTDADGISLLGKYGLFDKVIDTGATLGAAIATAGAVTMRVSNGALVSPGMLVKIASEWIYVKATGTPVTAVTTLSADWSASDDVFTAANGSLLNVGEIIRVGVEQAKVLDINGNSVYVKRGWNNTLQAAHLSAANVDVYRNFTIERGVNGSTAAAQSDAAVIYQQAVPADVNFLARKIAGRMLLDATGGFKSRGGDDQAGTTGYVYIMPKELDEIIDRYHIARAS